MWTITHTANNIYVELSRAPHTCKKKVKFLSTEYSYFSER